MQEYRLQKSAYPNFEGWVNMQERWVSLRRNGGSTWAGIYIIGEAENGLELLKLVKTQPPDIVIMDIKMPAMNGIDATRKLVAQNPSIGVVAFTMFEEEDLIVDMLEAGAKGYMLKNTSSREIVEAIHTVHNKGVYYCQSTNDRLARLIGLSNFNPYKQVDFPRFSHREKEIIQLICSQHSNKEMANILNLSIRTIEGHRENIIATIGAKNTIGLVIFAIKTGLYKIPPYKK